MKKYMLKTSMLSIATAVALTTVGCSSGGSSDSVVSTTETGTAIDGILVDSLVCIDVNANKACDDGEDSTRTDLYGQFSLTSTQTGPLLLVGGTDAGTGLEFTGSLQAPAGSAVITPLTSAVQALVESGSSAEDAETSVKVALGIDEAIDLTTFDPIEAISDPATAAAAQEILAKQALLQTIVHAATATVAGADDTVSIATTMDNVLSEIVQNFDGATAPVELTAETVTAVTRAVADEVYVDNLAALVAVKSTAEEAALVAVQTAEATEATVVAAASPEDVLLSFNTAITVANTTLEAEVAAAAAAAAEAAAALALSDLAALEEIAAAQVLADEIAAAIAAAEQAAVDAAAALVIAEQAAIDAATLEAYNAYLAAIVAQVEADAAAAAAAAAAEIAALEASILEAQLAADAAAAAAAAEAELLAAQAAELAAAELAAAELAAAEAAAAAALAQETLDLATAAALAAEEAAALDIAQAEAALYANNALNSATQAQASYLSVLDISASYSVDDELTAASTAASTASAFSDDANTSAIAALADTIAADAEVEVGLAQTAATNAATEATNAAIALSAAQGVVIAADIATAEAAATAAAILASKNEAVASSTAATASSNAAAADAAAAQLIADSNVNAQTAATAAATAASNASSAAATAATAVTTATNATTIAAAEAAADAAAEAATAAAGYAVTAAAELVNAQNATPPAPIVESDATWYDGKTLHGFWIDNYDGLEVMYEDVTLVGSSGSGIIEATEYSYDGNAWVTAPAGDDDLILIGGEWIGGTAGTETYDIDTTNTSIMTLMSTEAIRIDSIEDLSGQDINVTSEDGSIVIPVTFSSGAYRYHMSWRNIIPTYRLEWEPTDWDTGAVYASLEDYMNTNGNFYWDEVTRTRVETQKNPNGAIDNDALPIGTLTLGESGPLVAIQEDGTTTAAGTWTVINLPGQSVLTVQAVLTEGIANYDSYTEYGEISTTMYDATNDSVDNATVYMVEFEDAMPDFVADSEDEDIMMNDQALADIKAAVEAYQFPVTIDVAAYFVGTTKYFVKEDGTLGWRTYDVNGIDYTGNIDGIGSVAGTYSIVDNVMTLNRNTPNSATLVFNYVSPSQYGSGETFSVAFTLNGTTTVSESYSFDTVDARTVAIDAALAASTWSAELGSITEDEFTLLGNTANPIGTWWFVDDTTNMESIVISTDGSVVFSETVDGNPGESGTIYYTVHDHSTYGNVVGLKELEADTTYMEYIKFFESLDQTALQNAYPQVTWTSGAAAVKNAGINAVDTFDPWTDAGTFATVSYTDFSSLIVGMTFGNTSVDDDAYIGGNGVDAIVFAAGSTGDTGTVVIDSGDGTTGVGSYAVQTVDGIDTLVVTITSDLFDNDHIAFQMFDDGLGLTMYRGEIYDRWSDILLNTTAKDDVLNFLAP